MNASPLSPSGPLKAYATAAKWSLWLLLAGWLVLVLAWGALHAWIVPRIGELRPELEIEAGRVLGVPVRIGSIAARKEGMIPSLELSDVVLLDPRGREALRLPRVIAALSPRSLWNLGFEQLYIERPQLDVRRAADGRIFVAGLDFSRGGGDAGAPDWFVRQTEFVIRNGTVRWTDEVRGAPPLTLEQVDFVMRNGARRHALRLDATPPPAWGERFSVRGLFRQPLLSRRPGQWQQWEGQAYAEFTRIDVSQLRRYAHLGVEVSDGHGAVRAWADIVRGQLTGAMADIVLADVNTTLGRTLTPLALRSVSGRIGGKRLQGGFEFQTQRLQFETQDGQRWPGGNVFVQWIGAEGRQPARGEIRADKLDLGALTQVAARLPLGAATHSALAAYAPKGLVETVQAKWEGPMDALQKYEARGRAVRLEIASSAVAALPGFRGADVDFELTQAGGRGKLAVHQGAVDLPGVFEDPVIAIDALSADVQWQIKGQDIGVSVSSLKFSNADAQGEGHASWRTSQTGARYPGVLDLQASMSRANGARVHRYLPLGVPKAARDYVRESVVQGTATAARFRVRGDLRDFPFNDPRQGEFRITADVRDVTYAFVPRSVTGTGMAWPALTELSGELLFERNGMQVKRAAGRFSGATALKVKAEAQIPNWNSTVVGVTGEVRGALPQALAVVNNSPVSAMIGNALAKASATGNTDVRLKLELPVATLDKSKVQGSVVLAGNNVQITPDSPLLARAVGTVNFSERGFALVGARARALGGEVRLEGGTRGVAAVSIPGPSDASVALRAQGTATAEGLRQASELGFISRLARNASGSASYNLNLAFRRGVPEISLTSNLQGLALNLPSPAGKPADAALPLRYDNMLVREPAGGPAPGTGRLQDRISLEIGRLASITYVRDISGSEPRVIRGGILVGAGPGESDPVLEQGVTANINLASVNLDAWEDVLGQAAGATAAGATAGGASGSSPPRTPAGSPALAYLPTTMAVRAKELTVEGRTLHNVVVGGTREGLTWRANIDATELNGYVEYRQSAGTGAGRLQARLARLAVAASAAKQVEALMEEQPEKLPALDVVVDDFDLRGKKLGRLEIDAINRGAGAVAREGGVREWRLNKLNLTMPEATFSATGNWAAVNAQAVPPGGPRPGPLSPGERRRTVMNFKFDIADSGLLLARFGMKDVVRRGKGRMEGQVSWLGSPLTVDYSSMNGNFFVNMEAGQFLKADPGLAKLLGVLSLQSLPRRLSLDFRDVFSEGFAFDFVRGDVTIQNGIAATNNLQMKGVNAAVLMEGKADIARETQDIKVVVVPEINAGTASLVATMINPAIGLGTFLAQMFLRQPLMRAATQEFQIDGTWADPRIARVTRKSTAESGADGNDARAGRTTN
jgi:uncharacterized protein (TIGR02099 family)